jgi:pentatricopeptide repeat protein
MSAYSRTIPPYPGLFELHLQNEDGTRSSIYNRALNICRANYGELNRYDFLFILETIQDYSTSQQQFWESISVLARSSAARMGDFGGEESQLWQRAISSAVLGVYLKQDQEQFLHQVEVLAQRCGSSSGLDSKSQTEDEQRLDSQPLRSDAKILALTMLDSLLLMLNKKRAMDLFEALEEKDVVLPSRYLASFVRIAVSQLDGFLLERIGNMLVNNEKFSQEYPQDSAVISGSRTRPIHLSAKLMDSFVHGACESELYDLARAVFDQTLDAGRRYRVSTFNRILNSYSVKGFGFDIVAAAEAESKKVKRRRNSSRGKADMSGAVSSKGQITESEGNNPATAKAIAVVNPKDVAKYVVAMKDQGVVPNAVTLNILVKLYLEMAQYKVPDAPYWRTAFRTYNPSKLKPDLVTNNTLLAYYEKHKDLATMKRIYDSMAGVPTTVQHSKRDRRLQAKMVQHEPSEGQLQDKDEHQQQKQQHFQQQSRPTRSSRDIYTYNTMLHALLQHAVESKDIASIGQCFYDMEQDGITADTVTFNTNILYHITGGNLSSATQVFRSMERTAKTLRESVPEQEADQLSDPQLARTRSKPVKSVPTYAALSSLSQDTSSPTVVSSSVAEDTPSSPTTADHAPAPAPDVVTLTSLISGFGQANQMKKATQYFKEMTEQYKIQPNLKTYSTIVAGLHRAGNHEKAEKVWDIVLEEDAPAHQTPSLAWEASSVADDDAEQESSRTLTIMERRQVEARRKLYIDSLKG